MMQIPNLPNYMQVPQPNYNAVKIDVHNPMVNVPAQVPQYQAPAQEPQYATPTMPYYNYPQGQLYNYPQAPVQPYYMPPSISTPETAQAPAMVPPVVNQAPQAEAAPAQPVVAQEVPVQIAPETVPAPIVVQAPEVDKVEEKKEEAPAAVEAPKSEAETPVDTKTVEVVPPTPITPQVDLNAFISKLTNPDYEVQATAMEEIANLINENPAKATELLDTKIVDALTNIINADTSSLEGPSQEQTAARQKMLSNQPLNEDEQKLAMSMSPFEQAERNKSFAIFTSAIMQKLYGEEVQKLTNSTVPLTELPGAVTIVDQLKNNANPQVRTSAIEALSYIQTPAYAKDLNTIFTVAQQDQDTGVQEAAKAALAKLNEVSAEAQNETKQAA